MGHLLSGLTGKASSQSLKRPDVQGLRAVAVVPVVIYHAFRSFIPGGFIGVDIFFVISGYVISKTILREICAGSFSVATFYRRRVRRIFPALFTVIAFVFWASWFLLSPQDLVELAKTAISAVFFCSNIYLDTLSGYFDGVAGMKPLLHTWSLSVEEQFYLAYPLFLVLVFRCRPRLILPALASIAGVSVVFSSWMLGTNPREAFFYSFARAFELLIGGIVAVSGPTHKVNSRLRNGFSILGLILIIVPFFAYSEQTLFPGVAALLPCIGTAIVIWSGIDAVTVAGRVLSLPLLVFVGDLSYSLYLWHWPLLVLARHLFGELDSQTTWTCVCVGFGVSILSYYFVERPFLNPKQSGLPYLRVGLASMLAATAVCLVIVHRHGLPGRFSPLAQTIFASSGDYNHRRDVCHSGDKAPIPYKSNCSFGADGVYPDTAVWGDSHGAELAVALGEMLKEQNRSVMEITASACPPAINYSWLADDRPFCIAHNGDTLTHLIQDKGIHTVVLVAAYQGYRSNDFHKFAAGFLETVNRLTENGKRVIIVYPIPIMTFDPPSVLGVRSRLGLTLTTIGIDETEYSDKNGSAMKLLNGIRSSPSIFKVYPEKVFCEEDLCRVYSPASGVLYFNYSHLSLTGARLLVHTFPK